MSLEGLWVWGNETACDDTVSLNRDLPTPWDRPGSKSCLSATEHVATVHVAEGRPQRGERGGALTKLRGAAGSGLCSARLCLARFCWKKKRSDGCAR